MTTRSVDDERNDVIKYLKERSLWLRNLPGLSMSEYHRSYSGQVNELERMAIEIGQGKHVKEDV